MLCINPFNIDENLLLFNNFDYDDYNYIPGKQLTEEELKKIDLLINYDFENKSEHEIYFIVQHNTENIFNDNESIKFNKVKFEIIKQGKNHYYKYENDYKLYINNYSTYIELKKKLFYYFENLLILLNNQIEQDIKDYLNIKFFNNINKCQYYDCLKWFCCLFIYFFNSINNPKLNLNKINYKDFRKYILNHKKIMFYDIMKNILIDFKKIDYKYKYYEEVKAHLNFCLYHIVNHYYLLP